MTTQTLDPRTAPDPEPDPRGDTASDPAKSSAPGEGRTTPRASRDPWFDNIRFVAAVLICVMHFGALVMSRSDIVETIWTATWPLRIPVYVVMAGYFSSSEPLNRARSVALLRNVLFVYFAFVIISAGGRWSYSGDWTLDFALPSFGLWFLLSLFCWRVALPLLANLRWLGAWALAASLAVGFFPAFGPLFSASRTIVLFPLFVLGWHLRSRDLHSLLAPARVRWAAAGVLLALLGFGAYIADDLSRRTLVMRGHYLHGFDVQLNQAGFRLMALAMGVAGTLALLALIPRRRIPVISYLGSGSLYIYLLHLLVVKQVEASDLLDGIDSRFEVFALLAAAALLAMALASPPVRWATRWLVQPRYTWPFVNRGRQPTP